MTLTPEEALDWLLRFIDDRWTPYVGEVEIAPTKRGEAEAVLRQALAIKPKVLAKVWVSAQLELETTLYHYIAVQPNKGGVFTRHVAIVELD